MRKPRSMSALEDFSRVRLSPNFFMRDFLYSEIAGFHGVPNLPDDPDLAIAAGRQLCETLLEPLQADVRPARHPLRLPVAPRHRIRQSARANAAASRSMPPITSGICATPTAAWAPARLWWCPGSPIATPGGADWRGMAWWIHDHLPYAHLQFFPKLAAFNIQWHERPARRIESFIKPRGCLTKPGMANHDGTHADWYAGFPALKRAATAARPPAIRHSRRRC